MLLVEAHLNSINSNTNFQEKKGGVAPRSAARKIFNSWLRNILVGIKANYIVSSTITFSNISINRVILRQMLHYLEVCHGPLAAHISKGSWVWLLEYAWKQFTGCPVITGMFPAPTLTCKATKQE